MEPHDFRVGDADREHVAALLQQAVGQGMLTLDEFSDRTLPLKATMSSIHRAGNWQVPEQVTLKTRFSSVMIDLTQADIRCPVVTIDVDDICSSTDIVAPDDFTADLNGLRCMGSSANSRVRSAPPAARVHVVIRGNLRFGALTVKHPFGAWIRKALH